MHRLPWIALHLGKENAVPNILPNSDDELHKSLARALSMPAFDRAVAQTVERLGIDSGLSLLVIASRNGVKANELFAQLALAISQRNRQIPLDRVLLLYLLRAKLGFRFSSDFTRYAQRRVEEELRQGDPANTATVLELCSLLALEGESIDASVFFELSRQADRLIETAQDVQQLAYLAVALAERKLLAHTTAFRIAQRLISKSLKPGSPQAIATILSAFAESHYVDGAFLRFATRRICQTLARASFDSLESFLYRATSQRFCEPKWFDKIVNRLMALAAPDSRVHFFGLVRVYSSFAEVGLDHAALGKTLSRYLLQFADTLNPKNLCRLAWATTVFNHPEAHILFDMAKSLDSNDLPEFYISQLGRVAAARGEELSGDLGQAFRRWTSRAQNDPPEVNGFEIELARLVESLGHRCQLQQLIAGFHGDIMAEICSPHRVGNPRTLAIEFNGRKTHTIDGAELLVSGGDLIRRQIYRARGWLVLEITTTEWLAREGSARKRWLRKRISEALLADVAADVPEVQHPESETKEVFAAC